MSRDLALICLAAVIVVVAMVAATVMVVAAHATPTLASTVITASIGVAGVAIGRLTGGGPPPA